jgi:tetratricopeptide (TPR) repeat protein
MLAVALLTAGCEPEPPGATPAEFGRPGETDDVSSPSLPLTTVSGEAASHYRLGHVALGLGRRDEAREHFALATSADSAFAIAYLGLAETAIAPETAVRNLSLAARHAPGASEGERLWIQVATAASERNLGASLTAALELTEQFPAAPRAWMILAGAHAALGTIGESRAALHRAEELNPESVPILIALARSYLEHDPIDPQVAAELARRAIEHAPSETRIHLLLGDAHLAREESDQAREAYARAALLDPTSGDAKARLAYVDVLEGLYEEARAGYDAALAVARGVELAGVGIALALTHVYADEPQAAVEELFALADEWETSPIATDDREELQIRALTATAKIGLHYSLFTVAERAVERRAVLLRRQADRTESVSFGQRQEAAIAYMSAILAARRGDTDFAREEVERLIALVDEQSNPRKLEPAEEVLGLISLLAGEYQDAVSHLEGADLDQAYSRYLLGLAYTGIQDVDRAAALFEGLNRRNLGSVGFALVRPDATTGIP